MSYYETEWKYRCDNDCLMSGCPGHTAILGYQSTSDAILFDDGQGQKSYFDLNKLETFLEAIAHRSHSRVEFSGALQRAGLATLPHAESPGNNEEPLS